MRIRYEQPDDRRGIERVHIQAFPTGSEAFLVNLLRREAIPIISLIAEEIDLIVGHIMFSPMSLRHASSLKVMGLAPLAVLPEYQGKGIGSTLVRAGLKECLKSKIGAVAVLGDPGFYLRFGFRPARHFEMSSEYESVGDAFMILELIPGVLQDISGTINYHPVFKQL